MKVIKFRIKNYKSIVDSGDCYFSKIVTILAGKNESGKTSILEALEDFHEDKTIREEAKPSNHDGIPEVSVTFDILPDDIDDSFSGYKNTVNITLTKKYGSDGYELDEESRSLLGTAKDYTEENKSINKLLKEIGVLIRDRRDLTMPEFHPKNINEFITEIGNFVALVREKTFVEKATVLSKFEDIVKAIDNLKAEEEKVSDFVSKFIESHLPYFILFSSFDDKFPDSITIDELKDNAWAKDLQEVSEFDIEAITSTDEQERKRHEKKVNIDFTDKFNKFWTQDDIRLEINRDGEKINFWIMEDDEPYRPSQRSKGQQWYLSFYIKIVARVKDGKPNIILIDEPGLYLHAKAQKDLLNVLKNHSSEYPVVFSTHSPYLIEEDNLESVRLIEKRDKGKGGSKIIGKIHAHASADKDTMTPILTAIGLGLNDSITNLDHKNNVVVEGPADVFYLQSFKKIYPKLSNTNFINGGGSSNMGIVGAVLEGWGANVCYLFDNDSGKKQGIKRLNSWKVLDNQIKDVLDDEDVAIEDIFSSDDFKKYVLGDEKLSFKSKNSKYMKGKDKVLVARKFLQSVNSNNIKLGDHTKDNIKKLIKKISFDKHER